MIHCVYNHRSKVADFWDARLIRFVHHIWFVRACVCFSFVLGPQLSFLACTCIDVLLVVWSRRLNVRWRSSHFLLAVKQNYYFCGPRLWTHSMYCTVCLQEVWSSIHVLGFTNFSVVFLVFDVWSFRAVRFYVVVVRLWFRIIYSDTSANEDNSFRNHIR